MTSAVACAVAASSGCRQLFGIDDTEVAADAPSADAPTISSDAPIDGRGNQPDATPVDAAPPDDGSDALCPVTYTLELGGHFYRSPGFTTTWDLARDSCAADGANAYLAIPDSAPENTQISQWINNRAWLGIDDLATEGFYQTVRGGLPAYTNWQGGIPPFEPNDDCVTIKEDAGGDPGTWQTDPCSIERPFVCECQ